MSQSQPEDARLAVILSVLPEDAMFIKASWTGNLWTGEERCESNRHTVYTGYALEAGVIDPLSVSRAAADEAAVATDVSMLSPFVHVASELKPIKDGTVVAALIDEIIRLRAALSGKDE